MNSYKNSSKDVLSARIKKLSLEWDSERVLEANAAFIVVASTLLGIKFSKNLFMLTGAVALLLLQHVIMGCCPPVPLIRCMGVRTAQEINNEKTVLKMLRKDFIQNNTEVAEMLK